MSWEHSRPTRRSTLGLIGAGTAATVRGTADGASAQAAGAADAAGGGRVRLLLDGRPAAMGTYAFPAQVTEVVLDNGLARFAFGRDDAAGGVVTGWDDTSITATSVLVNGTELAHHLNGVDPRDPDRQHSFYVDASGGRTRLVCTEVRVLRVAHDLAEVVFADVTSTPLRHEHHLIMRAGVRGLYGYDILTATDATSINEVRMNTRWDRSVLDHCFNWERGKGRQPTYAYLATQQQLQDETWRVDGVNNPSLPSPESNAGGLKPGDVYTKYDWSLYHYENPMFGHFGHGFGAWFTPLGGVSDTTLAGFYGVGPQRQDLAIHQDALILNYFGANHYGLPAYDLPAGYRRLYGPWLTYLTVGDPDAPDYPDAMIDQAADIARAEIAANRAGAAWVSDPLYPAPAERTEVSGRIRIADGRPAGNLWVLLTTQALADDAAVYTLHEPTYFVRTRADGSFTLPGIPPAWRPGTDEPGTYTLYVFAADGSITDQYKQSGLAFHGSHHTLPPITWAPRQHGTFLWQIGRASRTGGEYALATRSPARPMPRGYEKPLLIPDDLDFTVGRSWEPADWYYAQVDGGTWTVRFPLAEVPRGTAYLTVSSSMQEGTPPAVTVNGTATGVVGTLPARNDSTIGRQADRSGYPGTGVLTFPASLLTAGDNTIAFTNASGTTGSVSGGFGWDTVVLEVDGPEPARPARLTGRVSSHGTAHGTSTWRVEVTNQGSGAANDVRLDSLLWSDGTRTADRAPAVAGPDPNAFPVPVAASLAPGASAAVTVTVTGSRPAVGFDRLQASFFANGGQVSGVARSARGS